MRYVRKQGSYWIKTNENTGFWIEIEGGYYATITNGSTSLLVPKYLIIDIQQNQQEQQNQQQNQQIEGSGNLFTRNELERNEPQRERKSQVKCQKCGLEGSYVKRKVKSHYYLYIRHKTNGKIKECLISRLA